MLNQSSMLDEKKQKRIIVAVTILLSTEVQTYF